MIRVIKDSISDYSNALIQADKVFRQAESYIKENYKEGSDLYKSAMKTALEVKKTATRPILDEYNSSMKEIFTGIRDKIKSAVAVAPSADMMSIIPLIKAGKLNETELQIVIDAHKNNYMDSKLIHDAVGKGVEFQTVEKVMDNLDTLQARVEEYFKTYHGEPLGRMSYNNALVMMGSTLEDTNEMVNNFLNTYGE